MAFEVEFVLLEPGDVEFLAGCSSFELPGDVFFVITDNPAIKSVLQSKDRKRDSYFVMIPVVLTPSVLCVTRNLPASLTGL